MAFGIFLQHGDQDAGGLALLCCQKYMVQHLLAQAFAAMIRVDQQQADIGIVRVGKAVGDGSNRCQSVIRKVQAKVLRCGRIYAGGCFGEKVGCLCFTGRLAGFEMHIIGRAGEKICDSRAV